ncbi:Non-specific serine/threonine protein kinase [Heracleum sosnowskyi]|uniref:non-specific serine/threonine protein kinase n=1 Tax=Heracleum sosnowskyi TaxID=360622 RepID=A0AAD8MRE5_9APIA|nr:Non-specific serine/threonine protein kinase [Heracleum sosnowskyi]
MEGSIARRTKSSRVVLPNYKIGRTLGIGAFGKVKLAHHILTGIKVAVKILERQSIDKKAAEKVRREINILRLLSHPHVVRLFEVIETPTTIYMVMEYMDSGELFDHITENGRLPEAEARYFFQQIISGVESCHLHMVVHRDLKPENLLLDKKRNVKIADFGLGNVMRDGHFLKTSCGSPNYASPEVITEQLYAGPEVDVWSCGIILFALLCARLPFDDDNLPGLYARIKSGIYTFPTHLSVGARDLIARILVTDPTIRISIPEIHKHPWFQLQLPPHIAVRPKIVPYDPKEINEDIFKEMVNSGCDSFELVSSLQNGVQNKGTVTYYLLLHNRFGAQCSHQNNKLSGGLPEECTDRPEVYLRSLPQFKTQWALGFRSTASAHETMTDVLKVFESLNVRWKKIGDYNMRCLLLSQFSTYSKPATLMDGPPIKDIYGNELTVTSLRSKALESHDAVKFEIQLYKATPELYVLDLQRIYGPPFLFLELCAAFFSLVVA